jgi:polysaccharide pyruvyl transferase WcaK-like protein
MVADGKKPLKVWLYTAIPERGQFQPFVRPPIQRAKSRLRHTLNCLWTNLSGQLHVDNFHYQIAKNLADNSNRGDIAIRLAVRQQILDVVGPQSVEFVELEWGKLTLEIVDEINSECDLFFIGGGGYIFIYGNGSGGRGFDDVLYLENIRCPVIAYGIGMNRLMHEDVRDLSDLPATTQGQVKAFSAACDHIAVRDADTLNLLNLHSDKPVSLIGDPVLFLRNIQAAAPGEKMGSRLSVGINLAAHGWRALEILTPLLPNIVQLLKHVQGTYGATFTYMLHHDFEEVAISFLRQQGIQMNVVSVDTLQLLESYGTLDFVICQMLHSCIFSTNRGIPFLNIAYDQKSVAFCELLGVPQCVLPHWSATATILKDRYDALFGNRDAIRQALIAAKIPLGAAQREFMQKAIATVGSAVVIT